MIALLTSAALAFPLNAPDPDEMAGHRCRYKAVDEDNNAPLESRKLSSEAPGIPTFDGDSRGRFAVHATDKLLKKAGKGKDIEAGSAATSLATSGVAVRFGCGGRAATADDFVRGCKRREACSVLVTVDGKTHQLEEGGQLGPILAPIESPAEALGLVAILDRYLFLPLTPGELESWAEEAAGYQAVEPALPWVTFEEHPHGFVIRAPRKVTCGCDNDVVRRAWWVSTDGRACQLDESAEPLALARERPSCD